MHDMTAPNDGFPVESPDYRRGFGDGMRAMGLIDGSLVTEVERLTKERDRYKSDWHAGAKMWLEAQHADLIARVRELEEDRARLDWLEKIALDGEDARSIEMERVQRSNKSDTFWSWPILKLRPVGEREMSLEWHRYAPPRPVVDDGYGGHWDIQGAEGVTLRAAIDAARKDAS